LTLYLLRAPTRQPQSLREFHNHLLSLRELHSHREDLYPKRTTTREV